MANHCMDEVKFRQGTKNVYISWFKLGILTTAYHYPF